MSTFQSAGGGVSGPNTYHFVVAQGGSVVGKSGKLYKAGDIFPKDESGSEALEDNLRNGFLIALNGYGHKLQWEHVLTPNAPGVDVSPIPSDQTMGDPAKTIRTGTLEIPAAPAKILRGGVVPAAVVRAAQAEKKPVPSVTGSPDGATQTLTPAGEGNHTEQVDSIWNLDPATLQDRSLEQLNVMLAERDPTLRADTREAAIEMLSMNFKGSH